MNNLLGNIYYLIPDRHNRNLHLIHFLRSIKKGNSLDHIKKHWLAKHKPVGGVKVGYQHCMLLTHNDIPAYPLILGKYHGNFFGYNVKTKTLEDIGGQVSDKDIVVVPEYTPYLGSQYGNAKKIMFVQNRPYKNLSQTDTDKSYKELGYDAILYCSQHLGSLLKDDDKLIAKYIPNYIDLDKFKQHSEKRIVGRVLAMPRKVPKDLSAILSYLKPFNIDFFLADSLSEAELIVEYQKSDIFLATGYPEGFGLPPLEAMACGCAVVGFTGGGAKEFMIEQQTALVADDGDTRSAAIQLLKILSDKTLKENLRRNGLEISQKYHQYKTEESLVKFFSKFY